MQNSTDQLSLEEEMVKKIHFLNEGNSFVFIDLRLSNQELDLIDQLKFDQIPKGDAKHYDRFGNLNLLKDELPLFLKEIGNNDEKVVDTIVEVISRTVENVVNASKKNSAWVCVRAFTPTSSYDIPRWHMDGTYYSLKSPLPYPGLVFKFAGTLKGSSTLFYHLPDDQRDRFLAHLNDRTFLSEFLDLTQAKLAKRGEGIFFIVGNNQKGAVHSEPKIHENRLFFSILVGDKAEIEELYFRWH